MNINEDNEAIKIVDSTEVAEIDLVEIDNEKNNRGDNFIKELLSYNFIAEEICLKTSLEKYNY